MHHGDPLSSRHSPHLPLQHMGPCAHSSTPTPGMGGVCSPLFSPPATNPRKHFSWGRSCCRRRQLPTTSPCTALGQTRTEHAAAAPRGAAGILLIPGTRAKQSAASALAQHQVQHSPGRTLPSQEALQPAQLLLGIGLLEMRHLTAAEHHTRAAFFLSPHPSCGFYGKPDSAVMAAPGRTAPDRTKSLLVTSPGIAPCLGSTP